ncbi:glycosyl transferase family 2 [Antricoccus suffuscus]|uniref:Glycosyl transferase family 2 n=1 Tax=Antricoccus suffuscus TaxID=1629062 RepID=A0A2T1A6Y9_9ACTN|nr:glycosyltransferase family 2 protein [Antricoccus suffuscus]PRZ44366.1 glycosyl transferase family 2 [Antricoccus suffuscus]
MSNDQVDATVAVVTRTKNRPILLDRAIESVLAQTYQDFSIVIVNDAGDPGPVNEVVGRHLERSKGRIRVIHNVVSSGREGAMNDGVRGSSSKYISIHDDDDSWHPEFLEKTVAHLEGSHDAGVMARTEVIYERIEAGSVVTESSEILAADKHEITLLDMLVRNYAPPISFLYRRSLHDEVGFYDNSLPVLADWDFNLRVLQRHTVGFLDGQPLAKWHHRRDAEGDLGNSVVVASADHSHYDIAIRDRYIRGTAQANGLGHYLFVAELVNRTNQGAHERTDHTNSLINALSDLAGHTDQKLHILGQDLHAELARIEKAIENINSANISATNRLIAQFGILNGRIDHIQNLINAQSLRARARRILNAPKSWR